MEKLTDFFKEIKLRLSSPLFASFIIAWLVINWRVVIALTFYKSVDLKQDGYVSFIKLIEQSVGLKNGFIYPFLYTLCYLFLYPILRNGLNAYSTMINTRGTARVLKIAGKSVMSTEQYILLRENYVVKQKELTGVINEQAEKIKLIAELQDQIDALSVKSDSYAASYQKVLDCSNIEKYNGFWELIFISDEQVYTKRIDLRQGRISYVDDQRSSKQLFLIKHIAQIGGSSSIIVIAEDQRDIAQKYDFFVVLQTQTTQKKSFKNIFPTGIIQELNEL